MDQILQEIPGVCCYLDDILIRSRLKEEHMYLLDKVLARLEQYGVHVKLSKCEFLKSEVQYLGHRTDSEGLHPTEEKVQAIRNAPPPTDLSASPWLGMINYYHKFLPNMSTTLQPLYALLHKDTKFEWSAACDDAFWKCKQELMKNTVLVLYDPSKESRLACDALSHGLGAVISHVINGKERPIAFSSRTLTSAEKSYAQIEKEALSIIFGVRRFHKFLYG